MDLNSQGMEFASEIVVKASMLNLKITEVPTTVFAAGRTRKPHLRTFPDGWRHLRFLLLYSPKWLFLIPGILLFFTGILGLMVLLNSSSGIEYIRESTLILGVILFSFQFIVFYHVHFNNCPCFHYFRFEYFYMYVMVLIVCYFHL